MTTTKPLPHLGEIAYQAGSVVVSLTHVREGVYRVRTVNGSGFELPSWTRSYASETAARLAARHASLIFKAYGDEQSVERLHSETVAILAEQERRTARYMHNAAVVAEAIRILDSIATLDDLALIVELRASFAT